MRLFYILLLSLNFFNVVIGTPTWSQISSIDAIKFHQVVSTADGTKLAAIELGPWISEGAGNIWLSTDSGLSWTEHVLGGSIQQWRGIDISDDGTKIVAGINQGNLWTSTDSGTTWTEVSSPTNKRFIGVKVSADGTKFGAVASFGGFWSSTDGTTWTKSSGISSHFFYGNLAMSDDGNKLVVAVMSGNLWSSTDSGDTWSEDTSIGATKIWQGVHMSGDGSKFMAVSNEGFYLSTDDGANWVKDTALSTHGNFLAMAADATGTNLYVAEYGSKDLHHSSNGGSSWTMTTHSVSGDWRSLAITTSGNLFGSQGDNLYEFATPTACTTDADCSSLGKWCPTNGGDCQYPKFCEENENVVSRVCTDCTSNTINEAGDDGSGADTTCDAGPEFNKLTTSPTLPYSNSKKLAASADGTKVVIRNLGNVSVSSDSGATWADHVLLSGTNVYYGDIDMSSDGSIIAVALSSNSWVSEVWISNNGGDTWAKDNSVPSNQKFTSVDVSSDGTKILVAMPNDYPWYSTDSGSSFSEFTNTPGDADWTAGAISDDGQTMVMTQVQEIHVSYNGGSSWTKQLDESQSDFKLVKCSSDCSIIIALDHGQEEIWYSHDKGRHWATVDIPAYDNEFKQLSMSSDGKQIAFTMSSSYARFSFDYGVTWVRYQVASGDGSANGVHVSPDGTRILAQLDSLYIQSAGPPPCAQNEKVVSNACVACGAGYSNTAGDDPSGADTTCDPISCGANLRVVNNDCVSCPAGTSNDAGDDASGVDTTCDPISCGANEHVVSNVCTTCPDTSTKPAGDDASGADTACICSVGQILNATSQCEACPTGSSGDGSACDKCPADYYVADVYISNNTVNYGSTLCADASDCNMKCSADGTCGGYITKDVLQNEVVGLSKNYRKLSRSEDGTKIVAVADNGGVHRSLDGGLTWTQTNCPTNLDFTLAGISNDGGTIIVAGVNTKLYKWFINSNNGIEFCLDFASWLSARHWGALAFDPYSHRIIACEYDGKCLYSKNFYQFYEHGTSEKWTNIVMSRNGAVVVASVEGTPRLKIGTFTGDPYNTSPTLSDWSTSSCILSYLVTTGGACYNWGNPLPETQDIAISQDGTKIAALIGKNVVYSSDSGASFMMDNMVDYNFGYNSIDMSNDGVTIVVACGDGEPGFINGLWYAWNKGDVLIYSGDKSQWSSSSSSTNDGWEPAGNGQKALHGIVISSIGIVAASAHGYDNALHLIRNGTVFEYGPLIAGSGNAYKKQGTACTTCPSGSNRPHGDDPSGALTRCICPADQILNATNQCEECPTGIGGNGSICDKCVVNYHVSSNQCTACPANGTRPVGDLFAGADTLCTCQADYIHNNGICEACPTGYDGDGLVCDKCASNYHVTQPGFLADNAKKYEGTDCAGSADCETKCYANATCAGYTIGFQGELLGSGTTTFCAILSGGTKCWGRDGNLINGWGDTTNRGDEANEMGTNLPYIAFDHNVLEIGSGSNSDFMCALLSNGDVKCYGNNGYNALNGGNSYTFANRKTIVSGAKGMSASSNHGCALMETGNLKCWGMDNRGQLGDGVSPANAWSSRTITDVSNINNAIDVAVGNYHSCALLDTGKVMCWGNSYTVGVQGNQMSPVEVPDIDGAIQIDAGFAATCALLNTGKIMCWGSSSNAYYGDNLASPSGHLSKHTVSDIGDTLPNAVKVSLGRDHACAVLVNGDLYCWGSNTYGQVGDGTTTQRNTPVKILSNVKDVEAGAKYATCAILQDYSVKCWGSGLTGQLGQGDTTDHSSPVSVDLGSNSFPSTAITYGPLVAGTGNSYSKQDKVCTACPHTSMRLSGDDPVAGLTECYCAVNNFLNETSHCEACADGYSGDGTVCDKCATDYHMSVAYPSNSNKYDGASCADDGICNGLCSVDSNCTGYTLGDWKIAWAEYYGTAAVGRGVVYNWGRGTYQAWVDGTQTTAMGTPTKIPGITNAVDVAIHSSGGCALLSDKTVSCWGKNKYTGNGGTDTTIKPPTIVAGLTDVVALKGRGQTYCALLSDKNLKCWGGAGSGEMGVGNSNHQPIPILAFGSNGDIEDFDIGYGHGCVIYTGGALKCAGYNYYGQVGMGGSGSSDNSFNSPTQVKKWGNSDATDAVSIHCGYQTSCYVSTDGKLRCWGNGGYAVGWAGNDPTTIATPISSSMDNPTWVTLGRYGGCAGVSNGDVYCWGGNSGYDTGDSYPKLTTFTGMVQQGGDSNVFVSEGGQVRSSGTGSAGELGHGETVTRYGWNNNKLVLLPNAGGSYGPLVNGTGNSKQKGAITCTACPSGTTLPVKGEPGLGLGSFCTRDTACDQNEYVNVTHGCQTCAGNFNDLGDTTVGQCDDPEKCLVNEHVKTTFDSDTETSYSGSACTSTGDCVTKCHGDAACAGYTEGEFTIDMAYHYGGMCVLSSSGKARCLGEAAGYRLGNQNQGSTDTLTFVDVDNIDGSSDDKFAIAIAGAYHGHLALMRDGSVMSWGCYSGTGLGGSCYWPDYLKKDSVKITNAIKIAHIYHACAILDTGEMLCWGSNYLGEVNTQRGTEKYGPVTAGGTSSWKMDGSTDERSVVDVALGDYLTCALMKDGKLRCWGNNGYGQTGQGTVNPSPYNYETSPSNNEATGIDGQTPASTVVKMKNGKEHMCVLMGDGSLKCWGRGTYGQFCNEDLADQHSPVTVFAGESIKDFTTGKVETCILTTVGELKCCGKGRIVGGGTNAPITTTPATIAGISNGIAIYSDPMDSIGKMCVLMEDRSMKCWGQNYQGGLGIGSSSPSYNPVSNSDVLNLQTYSANYGALVAGSGNSYTKNIACQACGAGYTNAAMDEVTLQVDTPCDFTPCLENFSVKSGACTACAAGATRVAGDADPLVDTYCICVENQYVSSGFCLACATGTNPAGDVGPANTYCNCGVNEKVTGGACVACTSGASRAVGDDLGAGDTYCTCGINQHIVSGVCTECPSGSTRAAGDDASGSNTECLIAPCASGYRVKDNACVACPAGMTNDAGDDNANGDTYCDSSTVCGEDEYVSNHVCTTCANGQEAAYGANPAGEDTVCTWGMCERDYYVDSSKNCRGCEPGKHKDPTSRQYTSTSCNGARTCKENKKVTYLYNKQDNTQYTNTNGYGDPFADIGLAEKACTWDPSCTAVVLEKIRHSQDQEIITSEFSSDTSQISGAQLSQGALSQHMRPILHNGKYYTIGEGGTGLQYASSNNMQYVYEMDIVGRTYEKRTATNYPTDDYHDFAVSHYNEKVFMCGHGSSDLHVLDLNTMAWTTDAATNDGPTCNEGEMYFEVIGDVLYALENSYGAYKYWTMTVSSNTYTWSSYTAIYYGAYHTSSGGAVMNYETTVVYNQKIYIVGGCSSSSTCNENYMNIFDPVTGTVTARKFIPFLSSTQNSVQDNMGMEQGKRLAGTLLIGSKLYLYAGTGRNWYAQAISSYYYGQEWVVLDLDTSEIYGGITNADYKLDLGGGQQCGYGEGKLVYVEEENKIYTWGSSYQCSSYSYGKRDIIRMTPQLTKFYLADSSSGTANQYMYDSLVKSTSTGVWGKTCRPCRGDSIHPAYTDTMTNSDYSNCTFSDCAVNQGSSGGSCFDCPTGKVRNPPISPATDNICTIPPCAADERVANHYVYETTTDKYGSNACAGTADCEAQCEASSSCEGYSNNGKQILGDWGVFGGLSNSNQWVGIKEIYVDNEVHGNYGHSGSKNAIAILDDGTLKTWGEDSFFGGTSWSQTGISAPAVTEFKFMKSGFGYISDGKAHVYTKSYGHDWHTSSNNYYYEYTGSRIYSNTNNGAFAVQNGAYAHVYGPCESGGRTSGCTSFYTTINSAQCADGELKVNTEAMACKSASGQSSIQAWGRKYSGGCNDGTHSDYTCKPSHNDYVLLENVYDGFAAARSDGSLVSWGRKSSGHNGDVANSAGASVIQIVSTSNGDGVLAALRSDGTVFGWGSSSPPSGLSGVTKLFNNYYAIAALKSDGTVVAWGNTDGGDSTAVPSGLSGVTDILPTQKNFAAVMGGTVQSWGEYDTTVTDVTQVVNNMWFYGVLKSDGTVTSWGRTCDNSYSCPPTMSNVKKLYAYGSGMAALSDTLYSWGATVSGTAVSKEKKFTHIGCKACVAPSTNEAGDTDLNGETVCDWGLCGQDQRASNKACVACDAGTFNFAGDPAAIDSTCDDPDTCVDNEYSHLAGMGGESIKYIGTVAGLGMSRDGTKVIAITSSSVKISTDGGVTFSTRSFSWYCGSCSGYNYFRGAAMSADGSVVAVTYSGHGLFVSRNGGLTDADWQSPHGNYDQNTGMYSVGMSADGSIIVGGVQSATEIALSTNTGNSFTNINNADFGTGQKHIAAAKHNGNIVIIIATRDGKVMRSTDGSSWAESTVSNPAGLAATKLDDWKSATISDDGKYVVIANRWYLYTSSDFGVTFTQDTSIGSEQVSFEDVQSSADGKNVYASLGADLLFSSDNYGATWNNLGSGSQKGRDTRSGHMQLKSDGTLYMAYTSLKKGIPSYACSACPSSGTRTGERIATEPFGCTFGTCNANERVVNYACVACDAGTFNDAGDDAGAGDTTCDDAEVCPANHYGVGNTCTPCQHGGTNAGGKVDSGLVCIYPDCQTDQYSTGDGQCLTCPVGRFMVTPINPSTSAECSCVADQYVSSIAFVASSNKYEGSSCSGNSDCETKCTADTSCEGFTNNGGGVEAWGATTDPGLTSGVTKIFSTNDAYAALKTDGSVVTWGTSSNGGTDPGLTSGVTKIFSTDTAFAALKSDGSVVAWGATGSGGSMSHPSANPTTGSGVVDIVGTTGAFAALKSDGSVWRWGDSYSGGGDNQGIPTVLQSGVTKLISGPNSICAVKSDGSVIGWGPGGGLTSNPSQYLGAGSLSNYNKIFSTGEAFAALMNDGSVKVWGDSDRGGTDPGITSGVVDIVSSYYAFVALKSDGSVQVWGATPTGATLSDPGLTSGVTKIFSTWWGAFAALKTDGSVVAWGYAGRGGTDPGITSGVVDIFSTGNAFAALKDDGSVQAWGSSTQGGTDPGITSGVTDIFSYYKGYAFAALKDDGSVQAWGSSTQGGTDPGITSGITKIFSSKHAFFAIVNPSLVYGPLAAGTGDSKAITRSECKSCPSGFTNAAGDDPNGAGTECDFTPCALNHYVDNNVCTPCAGGQFSAGGLVTSCSGVEYCAVNQKVVSNSCVNCPAGQQNALGVATDKAGVDGTCAAASCVTNQYSDGSICQNCAQHTGANSVGLDPSAGVTACVPTTCGNDQYVESNVCKLCDSKAYRLAGDQVFGGDTHCFCRDHHKVINKACVACEVGSNNPNLCYSGLQNHYCVCDANYHVVSNLCTACPGAATRAAGDYAGNADTHCTCGEDQHVASNACVACPAGTKRPAGDDSSGADTPCSCQENENVFIGYATNTNKYEGTSCSNTTDCETKCSAGGACEGYTNNGGSVQAWGDSTKGGTDPGITSGVTKIFSTQEAFAALKVDGSVQVWGDSSHGGSDPGITSGVTKIFSTNEAFAALKDDGSVKVWGNSAYGGADPGITSGVTKIFSNTYAFAALKSDGSVQAWGGSDKGGDDPGITSGVVDIASNDQAFAALKTDGSVQVWGNQWYGTGDDPGITSGVTKIFSTRWGAFAALKDDGSVQVWGDPGYGGTDPSIGAGSGVTEIFSTEGAFAALMDDGSVKAWGKSNYGGTDPSLTSGVVTIFSTQRAFAALKTDGSVKAWGDSGYGGTDPSIGAGSGVTEIFSTEGAFAALKTDGSVQVWGPASYGGSDPSIGAGSGVTTIVSSFQAFAALKDDGSVQVWGDPSYGGTDPSITSGVIDIFSTSYAFAAIKNPSFAYGPLVAGTGDSVEYKQECQACPTGSIRAAGDLVANGATVCACPENFHVSGGQCLACVAGTRAAGDDPLAGDTHCACNENHHVASNVCTACPSDSTRPAGDDASGDDTKCACDENFKVSTGSCSACPANTELAAGGDLAGDDTVCTCKENFYSNGGGSCSACGSGAVIASGSDPAAASVCTCDAGYELNGASCSACGSKEESIAGGACLCKDLHHVSGGACTACAAGSTHPAGDDKTVDTVCTNTLCAENERVQNNVCVPCIPGKLRAADDDATGANSACAYQGTQHEITAVGAYAFRIDTLANNAALTIRVGETHTFIRGTGGDPFRIVTAEDCAGKGCDLGQYSELPSSSLGMDDSEKDTTVTVFTPTLAGLHYYMSTTTPYRKGRIYVKYELCTITYPETILAQGCELSGEITLSGPLTIKFALARLRAQDGAVPQITAASGARHFTVSGGHKLTLENIDLNGGRGSEGGSILVDNGEIDANNVKFTDNVASSKGGAIRVKNAASKLSLNNILFADNQGSEGGALSIQDDLTQKVEIHNSDFKNNRASSGHGGAISTAGEVNITITNFEDNTANAGEGGAISATKDVTLTGSSFKRNKALKGGAMRASGIKVEMSNMVIEANEAVEEGGAFNAENSEFDVRTSTITGNKAKRGAAFRSRSTGCTTNCKKLRIRSSSLENNEATTAGGAVDFDGDANAEPQFWVQDSTLTGNTAGGQSSDFKKRGANVRIKAIDSVIGSIDGGAVDATCEAGQCDGRAHSTCASGTVGSKCECDGTSRHLDGVECKEHKACTGLDLDVEIRGPDKSHNRLCGTKDIAEITHKLDAKGKELANMIEAKLVSEGVAADQAYALAVEVFGEVNKCE